MAADSARPRLRDLEAQFYAVVATGGAARDIEAVIAGDHRLSSAERLTLYANMYFLRIRDVLRGDFPKVHRVLGDEGFDDLVVAYLRASPPAHPSIRNAGEQLPAFLAEHALSREHPWLAELAALERAHLEVFDGPDTATLDIDQLRQLRPDEYASLPLRLIASSILLRVQFAVDELWQTLDEEDSVSPAPRAAARTLVVWRQDLTVYHRAADAPEAELLDRIEASGTVSFGAVCEALAERRSAEDAPRLAFDILARWVSDGLLAAAVRRQKGMP